MYRGRRGHDRRPYCLHLFFIKGEGLWDSLQDERQECTDGIHSRSPAVFYFVGVDGADLAALVEIAFGQQQRCI